MKTKKKLGFILLVLLLIGTTCSSFYFYKLYNREKEKVKNSLSPSLENDYFTKLKILPSNEPAELPDIASNTYILESTLFSMSSTNYLLNVPLVLQNPEFPNGCELASATMLLNYYNVSITLQELVNEYLDKEEVYEQDGIRFGPDPSLKYAGDPRSSKRGWGTFAPYIQKLLQEVLNKKEIKDFTSMDLTGMSLPMLLNVTLEEPVLVWVGIDYQEADEVYMWYSTDKKNMYTYPKNAHVVVITGQDEKYYYVNDPLSKEKNKKVLKELLEKSYNSYGKQAVQLRSMN